MSYSHRLLFVLDNASLTGKLTRGKMTTAIDSLNAVSFAQEISPAAAWDHMSYPGAMTCPDTDLIPDFSMYESDITTPITSTDNIAAALDSSTDVAPQHASASGGTLSRKRPSTLVQMPPSYASYKKPKLEQSFAIEPVTPHLDRSPSSLSTSSCASAAAPSSMLNTTDGNNDVSQSVNGVYGGDCRGMVPPFMVPLSPNPSACTDEPADGELDLNYTSIPPAVNTCTLSPTPMHAGQTVTVHDSVPNPAVSSTPVSTDAPSSSCLTIPTREQAARRRALRRAALNKSRAKREETLCRSSSFDNSSHLAVDLSCEEMKSELMSTTAHDNLPSGSNGGVSPNGNGGMQGGSSEPVDKKAARAIRNREAAMKSRIEAKMKMRKLQDENNTLVVKVRSLSQENEALTAQLRSLLQHTLGVPMSEGQDVRQVLDLLAMDGRVPNGVVC